MGWASIVIRVRTFPHSLHASPSPVTTCISTMTDKSQQPKGRDRVISTLNMSIESLNLAKEAARVTPVKAAFGSVAILLIMIRVSSFLFCGETSKIHTYQDTLANNQDYIELGLCCADICRALQLGIGEKKLDDLSKSVCAGINQLTT